MIKNTLQTTRGIDVLTLTTTSVVSPVAAFASGIEQTNNGDMSLSANEVKMKETLKKAGLFAKSMNAILIC